MSSVFSTHETRALRRSVDLENVNPTPDDKIYEVYEIDRCMEWIARKNAENVALQFPDDMLCDAAKVALSVEEKLGRKVFILGDTTYGSCCVDEIAAKHVGANAVIHFGRSCLSPTCRIPVLHVFTPLRYPSALKFMNQLNERHFGGLLDVFQEKFREPSHTIILAYDITLTFLMEKIYKALSLRYTSLIVTQLCVDMGIDNRYEKCGPFCHRRKGKRHTSCCLGRSFCLPATYHDKSPRLIPPLVFFGPETPALENLTLSLKGHECYQCYVEGDGGFTLELRDTTKRNKFLRRRLFLIEKVREANVIGVVVGTLAMEGYLDSTKQIMSLIRASGRKCYLIAVGRPTPPKLANFLEIDVFVVIACPESARQLDLRGEYHKPIVTPYEVAAALATTSGDPDGENARRWEKSGGLDYIPDFRELLPGGSEPINSVEEYSVNTYGTDVSLLSGRIRSFGVDQTVSIDPVISSDVAVRDSMPLSVIHQGGGGEFLAGRSWKGLEVNMNEKSPSEIVPGRVGTASGYQTEEVSLGFKNDEAYS